MEHCGMESGYYDTRELSHHLCMGIVLSLSKSCKILLLLFRLQTIGASKIEAIFAGQSFKILLKILLKDGQREKRKKKKVKFGPPPKCKFLFAIKKLHQKS
jgi:hypothetical protein